MKYTKTKHGLQVTFESPVSIDNGFTNEFQGNFENEMEIYLDAKGIPSMIEWNVYDLEITEEIGLWFEGKTLIDYDGVLNCQKRQ